MIKLSKTGRGDLLKVAMIPCLGFVLAWVLFGQDKPELAELADPTAAPNRAHSQTRAAAPQTALPRPALEKLVSRNPFAPYAMVETPSSATERSAAAIVERRTSAEVSEAKSHVEVLTPPAVRIHAVLRTSEGPAVLTDAGVLREGDTVDGKFRVVSITEAGVTFGNL